MTSDDERFMRAALAEARKGFGHTSPNPAVGAVLVREGRIIAKGHHRAAGEPHAEIECLRKVDHPLRSDTTLYVTLEPCSTSGRTSPCTEAIVGAGVKSVVIGATDPNPKHLGRAQEVLRARGVAVRIGVLADKCAALNPAFNKWIQTKQPLVIAKCGMTLDGRLTLPAAGARWITSPAARDHANRRRALVDAILVGAETLRADDPQLTVRKVSGARQPWRIVLTRSGKLPRAARVFTDQFADRTLVFANQPLSAVLRDLGAREITSVLIEGGGNILGQALDTRLIDRVEIYFGPLLTGGPVLAFPGVGAGSTGEGIHLCDVSYEQVGNDIFMAGNTRNPNAISE